MAVFTRGAILARTLLVAAAGAAGWLGSGLDGSSSARARGPQDWAAPSDPTDSLVDAPLWIDRDRPVYGTLSLDSWWFEECDANRLAAALAPRRHRDRPALLPARDELIRMVNRPSRNLLAGSAISLASAANSEEDAFREPSEESEPLREFDFEILERQIARSGATRIEQVIEQLPASLRSSHVMMARSRSSHRSGSDAPRVILCSPTAKFMLAYSTAALDANRFSLEVIQWREESETFEFREVAFDPKGRKPPVFSQANPERCAGCHGDSLRPNWEPASIWPGAIGAGRVFTESEADRHRTLSQRAEKRLSLLIWSKVEAGKPTPAFQMAEHINALNARRVARFIRTSPEYDRYKYAIVAALFDSQDFAKIEPVRTARLDGPSSDSEFEDLLKNTRSTLTELLHQYYAPDSGSAIAKLRFLFERRGLSMRDVTTSNRSAFMLSGDIPKDFGAVIRLLYESDAELRSKAPLPEAVEQLYRAGNVRHDFEMKLRVASRDVEETRVWEREQARLVSEASPAESIPTSDRP